MPDPNYSDLVVDHFENPRHAGRFAAASDVIEGQGGTPERGAAFSLTARVMGEVIQSVRFEVYGCPHCVAAGSWLSERLVGCTSTDLERWSWREVADVLQVPLEKRGKLLMLEDAVRAMAADWKRSN
ncbi:MAG TPA: iron-sulfur cluster assembly scaffold protein [Steroidobacteraceae bacterium]|jgi:NifU-like protein involved in Fe-S cluster formation